MRWRTRRILALYRRHAIHRLGFAYSDGDIDIDEYARLQDQIRQTTSFTQLRRLMNRIHASGARPRRRWRGPRWAPAEDHHWVSVKHQWRKPHRYWPATGAMFFLAAVVVIIGLVVLVQWLVSRTPV